MLRRILFFFAAISLLAIRPAPGAELSAARLFRNTAPSIATLTVTAKDGQTYIGTAFMAKKDGIAVTAWHVVKDAVTVKATFSDGQEFSVSGLVDNDPKRDIALIRIKASGRKRLPLTRALIPVGSRVFAIGAPLGLEFSITDGLVSQVRQSDGMKVYQISCPISHGNSGGPILNSAGEVIGVVSFQLTEGQNLNFAIPSTYVLGLDETLPTKPWDGDNNLSPVGISAQKPKFPITVSNSDLDALLASSLEIDSDIHILLDYEHDRFASNIENLGTGLTHDFYRLHADTMSCLTNLNTVSSANPMRERLRSCQTKLLNKDLQAMDLFIKGVSEAQRSGKWAGIPSKLILQAEAIFAAAPRVKDAAFVPLLNSPSFANADPLLTASINNPKINQGFQLGIHTTFRDPVVAYFVDPTGIAYKLGIREGDIVYQLNSTPVASVFELRDKIKFLRGENVEITVLRDGELITLNANVPD